MTLRRALQAVVLLTIALRASAVAGDDAAQRHLGPVEQLLALDARPFAIAHRGFGENLGEDPSRPIENTVRAVRKGFLAGARVVEVDVQLTKDGKMAVFHDDVLPDATCLNQLTLSELQRRLPHVPSLQEVLDQTRRVMHGARRTDGVLIVELKPTRPLCDPDDAQERAIVTGAANVIRRARMTERVLFASFSPALLFLAHEHAPEVARILSISGLQFLTPEQVSLRLGEPVTLIDKELAVGLQWAEIGTTYRLPGYPSLPDVLRTAAIVGARAVEADLAFLVTAGAPAVAAVQAFGLAVFGFTATAPEEWFFLESLGVDGIYTDDVRFGVRHEAPRRSWRTRQRLLPTGWISRPRT